MIGVEKVLPQSERAIAAMRQMLSEASLLNNPTAAAAAGLVVGFSIGVSMCRLMGGRNIEIARLRADADALKQRIESFVR